MEERKLATIEKIVNLEEIPNSDNIEVATVRGWKVVVKKGEFKVGDLCVYFEVDSFLPLEEKYEFLKKNSYRKMGDIEGLRLKTIKLRGQISQGLVLPVSILPDISILPDKRYCDCAENYIVRDGFNIGNDVTDELGVVKWDPPVPARLGGKVKGNFPAFLRKTDEERIQNLSGIYENLKKSKYYVSEKLDGSSFTCYLNNDTFGVCSRNLELIETEGNAFWKATRNLRLEEYMRGINENICLQGELIGEGIQGNPYNLKGNTIKAFNIFDIDNQQYMNMFKFQNYCGLLQIEHVPFLSDRFELPEEIEDLIKLADGPSVLNPKTSREGLVLRNLERTISFKVISNQFLLKEKE